MFLRRDSLLYQLYVIPPSGREHLPYDPAVFRPVSKTCGFIHVVGGFFVMWKDDVKDNPAFWSLWRAVDVYLSIRINDAGGVLLVFKTHDIIPFLEVDLLSITIKVFLHAAPDAVT